MEVVVKISEADSVANKKNRCVLDEPIEIEDLRAFTAEPATSLRIMAR